MIGILLVDDHQLIRAGLETLLSDEPGFVVVGSASSGREAVALALEVHPDVILMDISMPNMNGIEATRKIHSADATAWVVMLTAHAERDRIIDAIDAGAIGYLLKDSNPNDLIQGVRAAANGASPLDPKAASAMIQDRRQSPVIELTEREREVLDLVGLGLANKQIAFRLGISEKTVKAHLTRVFAVLGVSDRTQAALWVHQRNDDSSGRAES